MEFRKKSSVRNAWVTVPPYYMINNNKFINLGPKTKQFFWFSVSFFSLFLYAKIKNKNCIHSKIHQEKKIDIYRCMWRT